MAENYRKKYVRISAKDGNGIAPDPKNIKETEKQLFVIDDTDISENEYFAVCANMWCEDGDICICGYAERLGHFESYQQAKIVINERYNGKKRCPECGFSHFRAREYKSLAFDNEYVTMCFNIDD